MIYLIINYFVDYTPFYFTIAQKKNWFVEFSPMGKGLVSAYQSLFWRVGLERVMLGFAQIAAFFLGLIMSLYVLIKLRFSYGIFMLTYLWICYSMSFWLSMPRFLISLFPMFIPLALFAENKFFRSIWVLISISLLIILSSIFIQYGPVF